MNGAESDFYEKIDCILKKRSKLEDIDSKLDDVIANVKALEVKVNHLNVDLQQIKDTQVKHDEKINALEESSQFNDERLSIAEANIVKAGRFQRSILMQLEKIYSILKPTAGVKN